MPIKLHYPRLHSLALCGFRDRDDLRGTGEKQADFFSAGKVIRCASCEKLLRVTGLNVDYHLRNHGGFGEGMDNE